MQDLISRQAVLSALTDIKYNHCDTEGQAQVIETAKILVTVMPSISWSHENDLINRQATIDVLIAELDMRKDSDDPWVSDGLDRYDVTGLVKQLPSALIHCRDCKFWQDQEDGVVEVPICARPQNKFERFPMVMIINGDGFCSFAERKIDGSDK